jgi:hypothetical protein
MLNIMLHRLHNQRLVGTSFTKPEAVVGWLGAVQAQEYMGAAWALGLRMQNATADDIEQAFTEGRILRTHVMRPTWHFVTPADIRWLLELTAPRVHALNAYMYRKLELDEALLKRSGEVMAKALSGGAYLTRAELGDALKQAGIAADGMRLGYIVHYAELERLVCSGPRRGKQFTYALLDERAPQAKSLPRDEALAELVKRFFTSHGPATPKDFSWWSGLSVADARAGLEMLKGQLTQEIVNGKEYSFSASMALDVNMPSTAFLLPTYDEFLVGYSAFDQSRRGGQEGGKNLVFDSIIVSGGEIIGSWKRVFNRGNVVVEFAPFRPFTPAETEAVEAAAQHFGRFLDMPVVFA